MNRRIAPYLVALASLASTLRSPAYSAPVRADGEFTIEVVDSATSQPIAARMHLYAGRNQGPRSASKRAVKLNMPGSAEFGDHFYIDGNLGPMCSLGIIVSIICITLIIVARRIGGGGDQIEGH